MATDLESIKKTLVGISKGEGILETLLEFERTLDNLEIFAYQNWIHGELVNGPIISRYWYTVTFMYPAKLMPNPDAGLRLTKLGAKVKFEKGTFKKPVAVKGPSDWADITTKKAKIKEHKVWLVTIEMPLKYIDKGLTNIDDIIDKDIDLDNADLADTYDESEGEQTEDYSDESTGDDMSAMPSDDMEENI